MLDGAGEARVEVDAVVRGGCHLVGGGAGGLV